ncbi:MAG: 2-C-methyl-D-erythritol 2,4-cyclodiphosphate synthase [Synergistaceae bacterium]|nr:2-C-methyl-D-erythritol 2,4-cyclodiphosphate synthase [Synergistaceae bacterium]
MQKNTWSFIIVAGGSGSRIGGIPKQFRELNGIPLWRWSAETAEKLWAAGEIKELVLVLPPTNFKNVESEDDLRIPLKITAGGDTRSDSVMNGLKICSGSHVLVHDAARPFITAGLCRRLIKKTEECGSGVPLLASSDSLKKISGGKITCVDRKEYFRTQTPQAFEKKSLISAIEQYGSKGKDEAEAWLAAGRELGVVDGIESNFKITTSFDLAIAYALAEGNIERRTGHGFDVHKLIPGRRLILAGMEISDSVIGLLGHSDADIITHTVMDAILGAAGEPDIGTLFPASDVKWKDAASTGMLDSVVQRIRASGWKIEWVDITLEAQTPRLGDMVPMFIASLAPYLSESDGERNLNIKIKSGEGCGSVGRSECMICHGVATLSRRKGKIALNA